MRSRRAAFLLAGACGFAAALPCPAGPEPAGRLRFAGYEWRVKSSERPTAPHDNRFGSLGQTVGLRPDGALALKVGRGPDGLWRSSEVILRESLGYGDYLFRVSSRLDLLDANLVAGFFTWDSAPDFEHREIDIEFSTWGGQLRGANAQYVVQPHDRPGQLRRFALAQEGGFTSHELRWRPGSVEFASWHGHGDRPPPGSPLLIQQWRAAGSFVPPPGQETIRVNFYLFEGRPPADGRDAELVVADFRYAPP